MTMAASSASASPEINAAGLAFIAGLLLSIFASLLYPGGMLIDPVDQTDFPGAIAALASNGFLAHVMTLLMIVAMLLEAFGLLALGWFPADSGLDFHFQRPLQDSGRPGATRKHSAALQVGWGWIPAFAGMTAKTRPTPAPSSGHGSVV